MQVFHVEELPHLRSTRDTRDRLDLITESVPVGATRIRADRVRYHPGDTAAAHFHVGCVHLFYVLEGEGVVHLDGEQHRVSPGMSIAVEPLEVHWFENDTDANFSFVEFWAPPPQDTVWIDAKDI